MTRNLQLSHADPFYPSVEENLRQARALFARAANLRQLRLPLLRRRARRKIQRALVELQHLGLGVDRRVPIVLDSCREYRLLCRASELLRGAPRGSTAHRLYGQAMSRALVLRVQSFLLPREMCAYTSFDRGRCELVINLDNPFFERHDRLLAILAHERQHLIDVVRAERLEAPGRAETRAFWAQALALGLADRFLGNWWRAPRGTQLDLIYPPRRLNRALIAGYLLGARRRAAQALQACTTEQRELAQCYLDGYRAVLARQAHAYHRAFRSDDRADPSTITRYHQTRSRILAEVQQRLQQQSLLTPQLATLLGQTDAYTQVSPGRRLLEITATEDPGKRCLSASAAADQPRFSPSQ
jgi:hypothetical protein